MKPLSWDKQLGLVSPLKHAASQSNETNHPSKNETGLDVSHHTHVSPEGRGKYCFLDILFHRMSAIGISQQLAELRGRSGGHTGCLAHLPDASLREKVFLPGTAFPAVVFAKCRWSPTPKTSPYSSVG